MWKYKKKCENIKSENIESLKTLKVWKYSQWKNIKSVTKSVKI